jgi:hypothetical protein
VYTDHEEFAVDLKAVQDAYAAEAAGPAVHRTLAAFLLQALPTLVRGLNRARAAEAEAATAALTAAVASLKSQLQVATATAAAAEANVSALRQERSGAVTDKARAETEARAAREEVARLSEALAGRDSELADTRAKLQAERMAHAQTRVALKAAGGTLPPGSSLSAGPGAGGGFVSPAGGSAVSSSSTGVSRSGGAHLSPDAAAALQALSSPAPHTRIGSVDMKEILGGGSGGAAFQIAAAHARTPTAAGGMGRRRTASGVEGDAALQMMPHGRDAEAIAAPVATSVQYPAATGSSGGQCAPGCTVQ